jgi:predicted transcriptional regulator
MAAKRRSKIEIVGDILFLMQRKGGKVKPTHILYGGNLSHDRLKIYVDELLTKQLIEEVQEEDKKFYRITDKGLKLVEELRKIKNVTDAFGL